MFRFNSLFLLMIAIVACTNTDSGNGVSYEPIYVNNLDMDISYIWRYNDEASFDTITIKSGDTLYAGIFNDIAIDLPILHESGLRWNEASELAQVILKFNQVPEKCLYFTIQTKNNDIRLFESYENIGECSYCIIRRMDSPDGMLYRITEEHLKMATDCDILEGPSVE